MADRSLAVAARRAGLTVLVAFALVVPAGAKSASTTPARTTPRTSTTPTTSTPRTTSATSIPAKPAKVKPAKPAKVKPAKPKPAPKPIAGYLGNGTKFPARALVLSVPPGVNLVASQVHVSENGSPVSGLTVTPLAQANTNDFGVEVVLDASSSMSGAPSSQAISAVQAMAGQRAPHQQLGMIVFASTPNVLLRPTTDPGAISQALTTTTGTSTGSNVSAALALALKELAHAKVASGAVILVSDGVGTQGAGAPAAAVAAAAAAAHVPIYTIGLRDSSATPSSMQQLAQVGGGRFVPATAANVSQTLTKIFTGLTQGYVVRYRSQQHTGQPVAVTAAVDGLPGVVNASYVSPVAPAPVLPRPQPHPHPAGPDFSHASLLTATPAFAPGTAAPAAAANRSFWTSSGSVLFVSAAAALLFALAVLILLLRRPSKQAVQVRVGSFIPGPLLLADGTLAPTPPAGNPLVRLIEGGRWWQPFVENVAVARSHHTPMALVKRAAGAGVFVAIVLMLVAGSALLGLLALIAWPFVLRSMMSRGARKQRERFRDLLPAHLQDLAGAMRAGRSVVGAIASVAESADEPIRSELERAVTDEQLGRPLEESLEAVATRMKADDMGQVALIAALNRRSGSNVAEALERVADGARERADLRREMKALTGQAKMSSMVLTGLPPLMLIGISVMAPQYAHPMFHTTFGIILLVIGTCMVLGGWKVMMKIVNVDP